MNVKNRIIMKNKIGTIAISEPVVQGLNKNRMEKVNYSQIIGENR
jgi:hypothetical protein